MYDQLCLDVQIENYFVDLKLLTFKILPPERKKTGEKRKIQCNVLLIGQVGNKTLVAENFHFDMPGPPVGREKEVKNY